MKKMTKWLALALAGVLMSASLTSCMRQITREDDDDEEDEEKSSVSSYVGLSPDQVKQMLFLADKFTIEASGSYTNGEDEESAVLTLKKYGDVILHRLDEQDSDGSNLVVQYYDLETMRSCISYDGEAWQFYSESDTRQEMLEFLLLDDDGVNLYYILNADSYEEGGSAENGYVMTEEAMAAWMRGPEGTEYEGKFTSKGNVYTFEFSAHLPSDSGNGDYKYTFTIRFTSESLEFPQETGTPE